MVMINDKYYKLYLKNENILNWISLEKYLDNNRYFLLPSFGSDKTSLESLKLKGKDQFVQLKNKLVALALTGSMLLSFTGCESKLDKTIKGLAKSGVQLENICDGDIYFISGIEDLPGYQTYAGIDVERLCSNPYSKISTPGDFGNNVTFDDLRDALKNNVNVTDDIKEILYEGINNLEAANFNMNYSVLYYNLSNLVVEYVSSDELVTGAVAQFNKYNSKVTICSDLSDNSEIFKQAVIHEIIGHGSNDAYDRERGILCSVSNLSMVIDSDGKINEISELGYFSVEAIAEVITSIASNKKLTVETSGYTAEVYSLITLCASLGIEIEDFANNGISLLLEKMKERGVLNYYQIISSLDNIRRSINIGFSVQSDLTYLFEDYYYLLLNSADTNEEKEYLTDSTNAYKEFIVPFTLTDDTGSSAMIGYAYNETYNIVLPDSVTLFVNKYCDKRSFNK